MKTETAVCDICGALGNAFRNVVFNSKDQKKRVVISTRVDVNVYNSEYKCLDEMTYTAPGHVCAPCMQKFVDILARKPAVEVRDGQ